MKTYTYTCQDGHEQMTWTVEAESPMDAGRMFIGMDEIQTHNAEKHPEAPKWPSDGHTGLVGTITPSE